MMRINCSPNVLNTLANELQKLGGDIDNLRLRAQSILSACHDCGQTDMILQSEQLAESLVVLRESLLYLSNEYKQMSEAMEEADDDLIRSMFSN